MQKAVSLYQAAHLQNALQELGDELRARPSDTKLRTFLFELLCFSGEFGRADKQLEVLAGQSEALVPGAALYRSLLRAHQDREAGFEAGAPRPQPSHPMVRASVNGTPYRICMDEDERIGQGLEVYTSEGYKVVPWTSIQRLEIAKPATLRDLLWIPAKLLLREQESTGEAEAVHLPALAPLSWKHADDAVRLGRTSVLEESETGEFVPFGVKLLLCDEETVSLLDVRSLEVIH